MELSLQTRWKIKINSIIMMKNRNYDISDEIFLLDGWKNYNSLLAKREAGQTLSKAELDKINDSIITKEIEVDYLNVVYTGDNNVKNLVSLCLNEGLNKESVIDIIDLAKDQECGKITLVINTLKHIGASGLNELSSRLGQIQTTLFTADEMIINPIAHIYSPIYRKLSEEEKENLARQINFKQLPLLRYSDIRELKLETKQQRSKLIHDAVVKYLDFQTGDVIEEKGVNFSLNLMVPEYLIYRYVK